MTARLRSMTVVTGALLACTLAGCVAPPQAPPPAATSPPVEDEETETDVPSAERGEYLVLAAGCDDCHTPGAIHGSPDMSRRLSGSDMPWVGPWGVSYARNLTPDARTGIGTWTEEGIVNALRNGLRPDRTLIKSPMPWPRTSLMRDEDLRDIAAFLKTLPPVEHESPPSLDPGSKVPPGALVFPPPPPWDAQGLPSVPSAGDGD